MLELWHEMRLKRYKEDVRGFRTKRIETQAKARIAKGAKPRRKMDGGLLCVSETELTSVRLIERAHARALADKLTLAEMMRIWRCIGRVIGAYANSLVSAAAAAAVPCSSSHSRLPSLLPLSTTISTTGPRVWRRRLWTHPLMCGNPLRLGMMTEVSAPSSEGRGLRSMPSRPWLRAVWSLPWGWSSRPSVSTLPAGGGRGPSPTSGPAEFRQWLWVPVQWQAWID